MCGIVGHVGISNSVDIILKGLTRLEYRGYDSAGICIKGAQNQFEMYKKTGKVENLKTLLQEDNLVAHIGIGHTRWATHGGVTDANAHPHINEDVAIIHNGIIENYAELKEELIRENYNFRSETDSEVFLGLVTKYFKGGKSLLDSVIHSFQLLKGNFSFVVMERNSNQIIALKRGAPLVCGSKKDAPDLFVSSDPYALVGYADNLFFPEDEVICILEGGRPIQFLELNKKTSERVTKKAQNLGLTESEKGPFEHFMLKEIYEQPEKIRKFADYYLKGAGLKKILDAASVTPEKVHISACGTAWHAGLMIRNFIEKLTRIPVQVELASEFRYKDPIISKKDVGIFISQSGETADTLAALELCSANGVTTINIGNVEGSTQFRKSDKNILLYGGVEIGVASTKAFTLMGLAGYLYALGLAKKLDAIRDREIIYDQLIGLSKKIENVLSQSEFIKSIANEIYKQKGFLFTGRGIYFPITLEGALKLKEIAYVHAEGYAGGELKHGPIALIDEEMVNVALVGPELSLKMISNVEEVKARKGIIVAIGPKEEKHLSSISNYYIPLEMKDGNELNPLQMNVVCQLLSYYIAKFKGTDIDRPRNLAKSVTVE